MVQQFQTQSGFSRAQTTNSGTAVAAAKSQSLESPVALRQQGRASNGSLATATGLGNLSSRKRINDTVGQRNRKDFFQVAVTEPGQIRLKFSNRSEASLTAAILDANGTVVNSRGRQQLLRVGAGVQVETLFQGSQPGVYYLRVTGPGRGNHRYQVDLFANSNLGPQPLPCGCGL
jgi:hypothetical protein